jgi:hypothetical protein
VCVRQRKHKEAGEGRICTILCTADCSGPVKASEAERTTSERKVGLQRLLKSGTSDERLIDGASERVQT